MSDSDDATPNREEQQSNQSEKPTVKLGDERDCYNHEQGDFDTYIPVEVRVHSEAEARKVGKIISEHWEGEESEHQHEVGETLTKIDSSEWTITNRMVDVDTDETLYRLREEISGQSPFAEILTESQVSRSFKEVDDAE